MPFELFLALRYLQRSKRRGGQRSARVTALAGVAGIACGVGALIFALALANGFQDEMRDKILRGTAHITLMRADGKPVEDARAVVARLRTVAGVADAAPTTYTGALLSGADGASYSVVRGIGQESERSLAEIRRTLTGGALEPLFAEARADVQPARGTRDAQPGDVNANHSEVDAGDGEPETKPGSVNADRDGIDANRDGLEAQRGGVGAQRGGVGAKGDEAGASQEEEAGGGLFGAFDPLGQETEGPPVAVIVGAELAARTGLRRVGDEGWLVTGEPTQEPPGLHPRARRVRVAGIFRSGLYEYDSSWVYVSLKDASELEGAKSSGGAQLISIETTDLYRTTETATRIRTLLGAGFKTVDWQEANAPLFAALQLERRTVALIIALIMFVAALNITTTLALVVIERRADIAILGAMGARPQSIMFIFLCEGAIIGATGAILGVALGLAACFVGERFKLVSLPADVYSLSVIPFHPHARDVLAAALIAFIISLLATIYPARAAARVRPAEALRYE